MQKRPRNHLQSSDVLGTSNALCSEIASLLMRALEADVVTARFGAAGLASTPVQSGSPVELSNRSL